MVDKTQSREQQLTHKLQLASGAVPKLAHDLRDCLTVMSGYADLLALESHGFTPLQKEWIAQIRTEVVCAQQEIAESILRLGTLLSLDEWEGPVEPRDAEHL
jgi:hypothetical protein